MSRQRALAQLQAEGWGDRVRFFEANTATVALAAQALGCEPAHIAKTLALRSPDGAVLVLAADRGVRQVDDGRERVEGGDGVHDAHSACRVHGTVQWILHKISRADGVLHAVRRSGAVVR